MTFWNTLRTAILGLRANKLRAALTTLGIIIGVASVIAMLALGNGARAAVEASFRYLGANQARISERKESEDGEFRAVGETLIYQDGLNMPSAVELVERVAMSVSGQAKVRRRRVVLDIGYNAPTADAMQELASGGEYQPVGWPEGTPLTVDAFIGKGRFFSPAEVIDAVEVCVLGYETAEDLFEGDDPIGETIYVNRTRCIVIGVLAELETIDPEYRYRSKPNEGVYLPISTAIRHFYEDAPTVYITAYIEDERRMDEAKAQIAAFLRQRHNVEKNEKGEYEDDFNITTRQDILGVQQEAANTFALLLAAMAAVSLIVGGIGIMNVMLVSVTERTREIGTRMAVGAHQGDIVGQFLLEAVLLSAGGGVLGIAVGILTIPLAAALNQGLALLSPTSIPLAFGVALCTGVIFGLYPALRAARLDPIEALRYE
ncbi:MAG: ABC transporter permease [Anaerolineae bacterium]|nr:ABC transporter permease [Anaerolineae bacterium]